MRNILPNLVYAGTGHEVKLVMVAGKILMRDQKILTADERVVHTEAQVEAEAIVQKVAADPVHKGLALLAVMEAGQL